MFQPWITVLRSMGKSLATQQPLPVSTLTSGVGSGFCFFTRTAVKLWVIGYVKRGYFGWINKLTSRTAGFICAAADPLVKRCNLIYWKDLKERGCLKSQFSWKNIRNFPWIIKHFPWFVRYSICGSPDIIVIIDFFITLLRSQVRLSESGFFHAPSVPSNFPNFL